jgi:hypothetical protein
VDVMRASASIDELIEKRAREKSTANELEAMYRESCRRHQDKQRRANRWECVRFFDRMSQSRARMSEDYQRRAEQLLEEPGGGG